VKRLAGQVRDLCDRESLRPFDAGAVAALAEHAARVGEEATRMASSFHLLADPCRQAALYARREGGKSVTAEHVRRSLSDAERRCSLGSEHQRSAIREGRILISTSGECIGEVNGLAVSSPIGHAFGYPVRITAVAAHGTSGLINIEREAKLSGTLHDKGMFLVQGYLNRRYGHATPLSMTASVAFEQLYGGIDGDSATAAEIYAILSSLSGSPLTSSIAVTGSVNQLGQVQPVGGVNEKIEGFFDACAGLAGGAERLPGDQGVLLPRANVGDLMLRPDVVEAVEAGRFHVWAMEMVDEGLELLTGGRAGVLDEEGAYPEGSLHAIVLERLQEFARHAAGHHADDEEGEARDT
jgi:predicted ATP-dependent protease